MVRIRLKRVGGKKHPFYRVVVADQRAARDGSFIEQIGTYDPFPDPPEIKIDEEKVTKWMKNGAQPSESVVSLLQSTGYLPKVNTVAPDAVEEKPAKTAPKAAAKAAPKAAATATAVAEAPAEKTPAEEAPKAEASADDSPAEDAPAEEAKEDSTSG